MWEMEIDGFLTSGEFSLLLRGSTLSGVHPMRDRSSIMVVLISIASFSEQVVEWGGLSVAGGENRTGLGSDGEVTLTSERLSSGGLSLSNNQSMREGLFMVKSVVVIKVTVDGQAVCT